MEYFNTIELFIIKAIQELAKKLLEGASLYQKQTLDVDAFVSSSKLMNLGVNPNQTKSLVQDLCDHAWSFRAPGPHWDQRFATALGNDAPVTHPPLEILLPSINIACGFCDAILPVHHPLSHNFDLRLQSKIPTRIRKETRSRMTLVTSGKPLHTNQKLEDIFYFPYLCQNCKIQPVSFMVRRCKGSLALVGRSSLPELTLPKELPAEKELFKRAIIGSKTGFTLAALSYARIFIERYMRRVTEIGEERLTGDELSDKYKDWIDGQYTQFPASAPSLKQVYASLSAALHRGTEDEQAIAVFETTSAEIIRHFEAIHLCSKFYLRTTLS